MTRFPAIGTHWEVETVRPLPDRLHRQVLARVAGFDATYSRFREDSVVAAAARAGSGGVFPFPGESAPMWDLYDALWQVTGGALDPLVGADLERLGYGVGYRLTSRGLRQPGAPPTWRADVERQGTVLRTRRPVVLDVGAMGKGLLVDLLCDLLRDGGIDSFLVDASGDMRAVGVGDTRVGLEHPGDATRVVGVIELRGQALCASATNRRAWGPGLHHVIDARTGEPTREVVATWALAASALLADALATGLFFADPADLASVAPFSCVRLLADGSVQHSADLPGELYP